MKIFISGLLALFLFAMASGIYFAYRNAEGLVEGNYYERGNAWFMARSEERRLGLDIVKPASLSTGSNEVKFILTEHGRPLRQADVKLFIGNVSNGDQDRSCPMKETAPGIYEARAIIPTTGKWLLRMDLATTQLKTSRSWFFDVR